VKSGSQTTRACAGMLERYPAPTCAAPAALTTHSM